MTRLYHATPYDVGDHLEPRYDHYLAKDALFLTSNLAMAYSYSLKTPLCLHNGSYNGTSILIIYDREEFYKNYKGAKIYQYDLDEKFSKLAHNDSEYVCETKLATKDNPIIHIEKIEEVMDQNIQIFFLSKFPAKDHKYKSSNIARDDFGHALELFEPLAKIRRNNEYFKLLGRLVKEGVLVYENGLKNHRPELLNIMNIAAQDCVLQNNNAEKNEENYTKVLESVSSLSPSASPHATAFNSLQSQQSRNI